MEPTELSFTELQRSTHSSNSNPAPIEATPIAEKDNLQSAAKTNNTIPQPDEPIYPKSFKLVLVIVALNLSIFCVGLDNTIISSAIPKITDQFHALDDVGWYGSAYLLTTCAFQLTWGKFYTFYSIKGTFLASLFVFELGSLICAVAPNSTTLIIGRAIAGVGGGGVGSGTFLLVAHSVSSRRRPALIGLVGGMYGFSSIAGPLLGGAFTDSSNFTWRGCFYINLPLGFITALCILLFVHTSGSQKGNKVSYKDQLKQMDLPGTALLMPGVICLLLALQWGGTKYEWKNARIIALLVLSVVILAGFVVIQMRSGDRATVPVRVFGNRNIWGSALFGGCVIGCFYVVLYYV
jgi:MFS family permease